MDIVFSSTTEQATAIRVGDNSAVEAFEAHLFGVLVIPIGIAWATI